MFAIHKGAKNILRDIYYLYTSVLKKKSPHSPRGSRNSHVNPKRRRIYTVEFYEDLKV
jgi:hypothetical protein